MAAAEVFDSDFYEFSRENELLDQLDLVDYFHDKLTIHDVRKHDVDKSVNNLRDVKWVFISKIIGLNSNARDVELEPMLKKEVKEQNASDFDDFLTNLMEQFSPTIKSSVKFHPLDIFLAIFCCCSPFLKQLIISKMFTCRLAIPLISTEWAHVGKPVIWSWPLRGIMIEGISADHKAIQESLIKSKIKAVSWIRIGRPSVSKSKLLNEVFTNQYYDTFFNKSCPLGTSSRSISSGLIEAAWFLPSRGNRDVFSDAIMFLNLRGDCIEYRKQANILSQISDVVVLVLESKQMNEKKTVETCTALQKAGISVVYAIDCNETEQESLKETVQSFMHKMKSFYKQMNVLNIVHEKGSATIKEELRAAIKSLLKGKTKTSLQEIIEKLSKINVISDETFPCCLTGKKKANQIMDVIRNKRKKEIMPLQNPTWIEWTQLLKQQRKASESYNMKQTDQMEQKLNKLRERQHAKCGRLSEAMKLLILTLVELEDSKDELKFFLGYLKIDMDEMSRINLPELLQIYQTKWKKWQSN